MTKCYTFERNRSSSFIKMFRNLFVLIISIFCGIGLCYSQQNSLNQQFHKVNHYLQLKDSIDDVKRNRIRTLTVSLDSYDKNLSSRGELQLLSKLAKEYEYFVYDSAFYYGNQALKLAYQLKDQTKIAETKSNMALVLLLKGLYKETIDTLNTINPEVLSPQKRVDFYSVAYRCYFDLANSRWGHFAPKYREIGDSYVQKIIDEGNPNSFEYLLALALQSQNRNENYDVLKYCNRLLSEHELESHQLAIINCILGISCIKLNEKEKAKKHLLEAVVNDIQSATKETIAAKVLAELLFQDGDLQKASKYISEAQNDASFYGSNARRLEISYIKPDIEAAVLNEVEKEKEFVSKISFAMAVLAVLLILLSLIIYRQLRALKRARKEILESNANLRQVNEMLREVSKIKEEYVGYYFNFSSQFIEKMEGMKKAISRQLLTKQYDAIEQELKQYNSKKERQNLFEDFDRIFLKLFPDFVNRFNLFFEKKEQITLKDSQSMNTDLRIFALIRLGISDNEKIASILNFSVNTIYTYKTKIKNRSLISNDDFERKIMEIKSV